MSTNKRLKMKITVQESCYCNDDIIIDAKCACLLNCIFNMDFVDNSK